jgi:hypothetical protein
MSEAMFKFNFMKKILLIVSLLITNSFYGQDVTTLINKAANENTVSSLEQMSDGELLAYWNKGTSGRL